MLDLRSLCANLKFLMKFESYQGPSFKAEMIRASPAKYELDNGGGSYTGTR